MGAWGHHFDENDDAGDWLAEFEDAPDWAVVGSALEAASDAEYVEAPEASNALAALEIIAAASGKPSSRLPEAIVTWATENAAGVVAFDDDARTVLATVRNVSELAELWDEGDEGELWRSTVDELANRLNS